MFWHLLVVDLSAGHRQYSPTFTGIVWHSCLICLYVVPWNTLWWTWLVIIVDTGSVHEWVSIGSFNSSYHLCDYVIFWFWILWFLFKHVKHVCNHKLVMVAHDHKLVIQMLVISIDEAKQIRNGFILANHRKHIKEPASFSSIYQSSWWTFVKNEWHSWLVNKVGAVLYTEIWGMLR